MGHTLDRRRRLTCQLPHSSGDYPTAKDTIRGVRRSWVPGLGAVSTLILLAGLLASTGAVAHALVVSQELDELTRPPGDPGVSHENVATTSHPAPLMVLGLGLLALGMALTRSCTMLFSRLSVRLPLRWNRSSHPVTQVARHRHRCPDCGSDEIERVRRHGLVELTILPVLRWRCYRCLACDRRFADRRSRPVLHDTVSRPSGDAGRLRAHPVPRRARAWAQRARGPLPPPQGARKMCA